MRNSETVQDYERKIQRIVNAYHRCFKSEDGKTVLEDIVTVFGIDRPAYIPLEDPQNPRCMRYDDTHGKLRDGQRSVLLHIQARLKRTAQGDANIEPKTKVIRP